MTKNSNRWIFESSDNKKRFKRKFFHFSLALLIFLIFLSVPIYVVGLGATFFLYFDVIFDIVVSGQYNADYLVQFILYLFVSNEILVYSLQIVSSILTAFMAVAFYKSKYRYDIFKPFKRKHIESSTSKYFIFICIGATIASEFIISFVRLFLENHGLIENYGNTVSSFPASALGVALYFISVVIVAPLTEEYFFRGVLFEELAPYGVKFSIFFSSAAFALMHRSATIFFFAFVFGIFNCILYMKTNSIKYPIITHVIINLLSFIENIIVNTDIFHLSFVFHYLTSTLFFAFAFISAIILMLKKQTLLGNEYNNNRINVSDTFYISKKVKFTYIFNVPLILFLVVTIIIPLVEFIFL